MKTVYDVCIFYNNKPFVLITHKTERDAILYCKCNNWNFESASTGCHYNMYVVSRSGD